MKNYFKIAGICFLLASCATKADVYKPIDADVLAGKYEAAVGQIATAQTPPKDKKEPKNPIYKKNNQISMYLDRGLIEHYAANYDSSYTDLLEAEKAIEAAYTKSVSADLASYLANDNTKDYAGEDYEDVYVNIFNALNSYQLKNGNALAFINDLTAQGGELQVLASRYAQDESKAKKALADATKAVGSVFTFGSVQWPEAKPVTFTNSALARYLGAVFDLSDGNKDAARYNMFELQNAFKTPVYNGIAIPAALTVSGNRGDEKGPLLDIPSGKGQLNVLAFAGLAPYKAEHVDTPVFPFLALLYPSLAIDGGKWLTAKIKVPVLVPRPSTISGVSVTVQGGETLKLDLLEDISAIITDTFNGHQSAIYLKTYSRVVEKLVAAAVAGKAAEEGARQSNLPELAARSIGIGVFKTAQAALEETESADIRSGRYLPGKAYIGALNLDPGAYDITIKYVGGESITKTVIIRAGAICLVETTCLK